MTERGDDLQRRLLELFREELSSHLATLGSGLLELERSPRAALPEALMRELFRAAHSIKGSAHAVARLDIVQVADRLETTFAALVHDESELDETLISRLFASLDELTQLSQQLDEPARAADAGRVQRSGAPTDARNPALRIASTKLDDLMGHTVELAALAQRVETLADLVERSGTRPSRSAAAAGLPGDETHDARAAQAAALAPSVRRDARRLTGELATAALSLRLQPFAEVVQGFDRALRDLARETRTAVELEVEGGETELDRDVASALRDPLLHLVRNAVAHGIEPPEQRRSAGKSEHGTVRITATARGDQIEVRVHDDGRGVDYAALREAATRAGVPDVDDGLSTAFLPGISTAGGVTAASGRGVGLDAVRGAVECLGGSALIETDPGQGTTVVLTAPVTRSTAHMLLVSVTGGALLGVPTAQVRRLLAVPRDELSQIDGRDVAMVEGQALPVIPLAAALGLTDRSTDEGRAVRLVVVDEAAFVVEAFTDELEVVLEALPARLTGMTELIGVTTYGDGRVVLVVNVPACVRQGLRTARQSIITTPVPHRGPVTVLLVEDTVTTRALERSILEAAGYEVIVAIDGLEAWELLDSHQVDVVVSDVDMPRMDGVALCRAIRSSSRLRDLPVVLVTSLEGEADRDRGMQAGASAYVVKSAFDQRRLLEVIEEVR